MKKVNKKKMFHLKNIKILQIFNRRKNNNYRSIYKRKEILDFLKNELNNSTTHGLPYLVDNRINYLEKFFWVVSFVACLILAALLLNVQYLRFVAAPTVMSVEMNYFDWNISYPAITICPIYKPDPKLYHAIVNATTNRTGLKVNPFFYALTQCSIHELEFFKLEHTEEINALIHPNDYATFAATMFVKFEDHLLTIASNLSLSVDAVMTEMGMCHVINSNVAKYDDPMSWKAKIANPYVKRNLELSIYESNFFIQLHNYSNIFRVFIHSPDEITTSSTSAFRLDVLGKIKFGVSVWSSRISDELRYKSLHVRKCRFTHEATSIRYPIYSHSHCMLECRIKMIKKLCGCVPHFYKPLNHERICYLAELKCVMYYRKEIVRLETSKETLEKFNYSTDLPRISLDCGCLSTCDLDMYYKDHEDYVPLKNHNEVLIKITSFPKVRFVRDIIFNGYDMFLRSGGVINLCIGSSIISILELVLIGLKMCVYTLAQLFYQLGNLIVWLFKKTKHY